MLLAVDTSTPQIGLALYDGAQVLAESVWMGKSRHTVDLAPAVAEMLTRTGTTTQNLTALGIAIGPGSFTSLRVGIAFVKGLALACALPVIGINTLEVVAAGQPVGKLPLACLLPAGRGRLALGWYRAAGKNWQPENKPMVITPQALAESISEDAIVCGDLNSAERLLLSKNPHIHLVSPALGLRRPGILAELAYARLQAGKVDELHSLAPLYLHIAEPIADVTPAPITSSSAEGQTA